MRPRCFEHLDARPGQYTEKDISPYLWHNGKYPDSAEYRSLQADDFRDYRLRIGGLVDNPVELDLTALDPFGITKRTTGDPRGRVPTDCHKLTVGIDVGKRLCHWKALAWREGQGPHVVAR